MRRPHVEDRGRPRRQQVEQTEADARAHRSLIVRRFEGPDSRAKPSEKRHVLGKTAEERLHQVDVCLHQAGHHDTARDIDRFRVGRRRDLPHPADPRAAHEEVAGHGARRIAQREQRAAAEQNAHA